MHFPNDIICLTESLQKHFIGNKLTLAAAESCTGGLLSACLTKISGCSTYYMGGVVCYSNQSKIISLGVDPGIINEFGAVSEQCALEMSKGIRELLSTDVGISITGIAGPSGGTPAKPVGTVWIAIINKQQHQAFMFNFEGDRDKIRTASVKTALELLHKIMKGQ